MRKLFISVVGSFLLVACAKTDLTCSSSKTLESLVTCIRTQMPQSESTGYVAPTSTQGADWRTAVNRMLQGSCNFAVPASLNGMVKTFTDRGNGRNYCLLMEVLDQNGATVTWTTTWDVPRL